MAASIPSMPSFPIDTTLYAADGETTMHLTDGAALGIEIQSKINFAQVALTPANASALASTIAIWLMQRADAGDAAAQRILDSKREIAARIHAKYGGRD